MAVQHEKRSAGKAPRGSHCRAFPRYAFMARVSNFTCNNETPCSPYKEAWMSAEKQTIGFAAHRRRVESTTARSGAARRGVVGVDRGTANHPTILRITARPGFAMNRLVERNRGGRSKRTGGKRAGGDAGDAGTRRSVPFAVSAIPTPTTACHTTAE